MNLFFTILFYMVKFSLKNNIIYIEFQVLDFFYVYKLLLFLNLRDEFRAISRNTQDYINQKDLSKSHFFYSQTRAHTLKKQNINFQIFFKGFRK